MFKEKNIIVGDWLLTFTRPRRARPGRVTVSVENAEAEDLAFAQALGRLAEMWLNATRKARR